MTESSSGRRSVASLLRRLLHDAANRDRLPILFLALVVLLFFLPSLVTPGVLIWPHSGLGSDISYRHWPDLIGYARSWSAGRIPVWDSLVAMGRPLAGDPTVLFLYPFVILFTWAPPALAFNALDALHVFLASLFMFLFLRLGHSVSRPAALVGAITYAFAPKFVAHLAGGHVGLVWGVAWAPAVLLGLQLAFDGWLLGAALGGLAMALQMPTHLQMPYYTAVVASAYWVWHIIPPLRRMARGGWGAWQPVRRLVAAYVTFLVAFGLLAAATLLPLLELLPHNSRGNFSLADANLYALPPFMLITMLVPSKFQFPEWTMFIGLLPLVLGCTAILASRKRLWCFFALLAASALVYALGASTPVFALTNALIPGFKMLRVPTRLWFFGGLAIAVMAGFGADLVRLEATRAYVRSRSRWLATAAAVYVAGALIAWVGYRIMFGNWHEPMALRLVTAVLVIAAGAAWLKGRLGNSALQWMLIPILLLDLLPLASAHTDLVVPQSAFLRSTPALDYVSAQAGVFRVYSIAGDLPYAVAAARGVESLEGLLAFQINHAGRAVREATGCKAASYATAMPPCLTDRDRTAIPDAKNLGRLNVRYVLSHELLNDSDFKLVMSGEPAVYENLLWMPRARLTNGGAAEIADRGAGEFEIRVDAAAPGLLIVAETWLPGWQATVDGQPRPVERAEDALIGVAVEPGKHVARLVYDPLAWEIGWRITVSALAGLAIWIAVVLWRRKAR